MPKKKTSVLEGNIDHALGGKSKLRASSGKFATDPVKKVTDAFYGKKKKR